MTKLKFAKVDIGFKELPGETSLLIEVTNCQNNCKGCHSPHLQKDIGTSMNSIYDVINQYADFITAICFLGHGSSEQKEEFLGLIKDFRIYYPKLKIGLYSGNDKTDLDFMKVLDYYKVGRYVEALGGLESPTTNQIMYHIKDGKMFGTIKFYDEPKDSLESVQGHKHEGLEDPGTVMNIPKWKATSSVSGSDKVTYVSGGVKETAIDGKPKTMFQLIDPDYIEGIGDVLTMGAIKYSPNNWKKVDRGEYERAMYHHMNEYLKGNLLDEDSGQPHLYHLATNVMFIDWFDRQ